MRFAHVMPLAVMAAIVTTSVAAQQVRSFAGDYLATSGPIHVKLHLVQTGDSLGGTLDSPEFRVVGLPLSDVRMSGQSLSFTVPTINGAWTGFLSEDGNALSGTWSQGKPMALNFTRATNSESQAAALPSSPSNLPSDSACPAGSMANYWDGSSWKPMTMVAEGGKNRDVSVTRSLRNPLNPMAGYANVFVFEGTSAPLTLGQNPRFCFPVTPNSPPQYSIGVLTVKKNDREVEKFITDRNNPGGNLLFPANKTLETNARPLSAGFIEVTPKKPLKEGQYVIAFGMLMFDFGVK